jgi:glycosyltransferase involved in cell wall biosynthesis
MPVFNAGTFLDAAVGSILEQSFRAFEFIIVDDDSTDGSRQRMEEWASRDPRIRIVPSRARLGLSGSSNLAVAHAACPTVARMDADDVCHQDRLRRQWEVLARNSAVVLVGALADGIDAAGRRVRPRDRWRVVRRSSFAPFPHGSVMFRKAVFDAVGGYSEAAAGYEDQDLFHRMAARGRVVTLPDLLYRYRYHMLNTTGADGPARAHPLPPSPDSAVRHYAKGAVRLWGGRNPDVLRALWSDPGTLRHPRGVPLLLWAAWAEISPGTLRRCLWSLIAARDRVCGLWVRDGRAYEWRCRFE